ncbi:hypothetical protein [Streptomyces sp. ODS28]|uniref:hypothetical protein n=1 Tax=Streptomyces sp. ODS28 TaxID=3136688 RepID=UPI0031E71638
MRIRNILTTLATAAATVAAALTGACAAAADDIPTVTASPQGPANTVAHETAALTDAFGSLQQTADNLPR